MKRSLLLFLAFGCLVTYANAQRLTWTPIADYFEPRYSPYAFMLGDRFFLGGGLKTQSPLLATNDLKEYDVTNNQWVSRASLPPSVNMYDERQFVINGKGYTSCGQLVPGGYLSTLYEYDPVLDTWTAKAAFPGTPRYTPSAFSIGNYGYMGLGFTPYESDFFRYDPSTDTWTAIDSFPGAARQSVINFVINGKAYVGLGSSASGFMNDMYKYDTATGKWTQMASFPGVPRAVASTIVMNNKAYLLGGEDASLTPLADIWSYDPATDTWSPEDTLTPLALATIVTGGNGTFAIAGTGRDSSGGFSNRLFKTGSPSTGINESEKKQVRVWFNDSGLHIVFNGPLSAPGSVSVYDAEGRQLSSVSLTQDRHSFDIDMSAYASGMYIYSIKSGDYLVPSQTGKVLKGN